MNQFNIVRFNRLVHDTGHNTGTHRIGVYDDGSRNQGFMMHFHRGGVMNPNYPSGGWWWDYKEKD